MYQEAAKYQDQAKLGHGMTLSYLRCDRGDGIWESQEFE